MGVDSVRAQQIGGDGLRWKSICGAAWLRTAKRGGDARREWGSLRDRQRCWFWCSRVLVPKHRPTDVDVVGQQLNGQLPVNGHNRSLYRGPADVYTAFVGVGALASYAWTPPLRCRCSAMKPCTTWRPNALGAPVHTHRRAADVYTAFAGVGALAS